MSPNHLNEEIHPNWRLFSTLRWEVPIHTQQNIQALQKLLHHCRNMFRLPATKTRLFDNISNSPKITTRILSGVVWNQNLLSADAEVEQHCGSVPCPRTCCLPGIKKKYNPTRQTKTLKYLLHTYFWRNTWPGEWGQQCEYWNITAANVH